MKQRSFSSILSNIAWCALVSTLMVTGCGATPNNASAPLLSNPQRTTLLKRSLSDKGIHQDWQPLVQRLHIDLPNTQIDQYFDGLPEFSPAPMGAKVRELFKIAFTQKPLVKKKSALPISYIYRGVVTAENVSKCKDFLAQNKQAFNGMEQKYKVPREIVVSLLMVETKLGTYLGNSNAFWSLASMAAADTPILIEKEISSLPLTPKHTDWLQTKLTDKSSWAYKELKALLVYCSENSLNPQAMPGSVYGAIGICQFMPSNINTYGADGSGSGKINLFDPADAIASAGKYLSLNGWKPGISIAQQRKVLKRYNNLTRYANTILALGESIKTGKLFTGPPDALQKKGNKTKSSKKKSTITSKKKLAPAKKAHLQVKKESF